MQYPQNNLFLKCSYIIEPPTTESFFFVTILYILNSVTWLRLVAISKRHSNDQN